MNHSNHFRFVFDLQIEVTQFIPLYMRPDEIITYFKLIRASGDFPYYDISKVADSIWKEWNSTTSYFAFSVSPQGSSQSKDLSMELVRDS